MRRQPGRRTPDRGLARSRLQLRGGRHPIGRGGGCGAGRRPDRDRAGDRGGENLQARHPLLGAARGHLPRRARAGAPDRHGQLRDRPGADRRGGDRAGSRREGHRVAALDRALGRAPRRARQGRRRGAEAADELYAELRERGNEVVYDDRDAGPGEKLTDAELLGCPLRLVVGRRALAEGAVEAQARRTRGRRSACRSPSAARRWPSSCSMASTRRLFGLDRSAAPGPPQTRRGRAAAAAHGPQPGRLHAARRDPGLPLPGPELRRRAHARPPRSSIWRSRPATTSTGSSPASPASTAAWARCSIRSSTG